MVLALVVIGYEFTCVPKEICVQVLVPSTKCVPVQVVIGYEFISPNRDMFPGTWPVNIFLIHLYAWFPHIMCAIFHYIGNAIHRYVAYAYSCLLVICVCCLILLRDLLFLANTSVCYRIVYVLSRAHASHAFVWKQVLSPNMYDWPVTNAVARSMHNFVLGSIA